MDNFAFLAFDVCKQMWLDGSYEYLKCSDIICYWVHFNYNFKIFLFLFITEY